MIVTIVLVILVVTLFAALIDNQNKLHLARVEIKAMAKRDRQWSRYADHLENEVTRLNETLTMVQSLYHKAIEQSKDSSSKLMQQVITLKASKAGNGSANGGNGNNKPNTPKTAPAAPQSSTDGSLAKAAQDQRVAMGTATLADLGTITPKEQSLIDKWHAGNTNDAECAKRIANIRASESKKQTVKIN